MKKKFLGLIFASILLISLSTQITAASSSMTISAADGTAYTMSANYRDVYRIGKMFKVELKLTAEYFGTVSNVIGAFYDIRIVVSIVGDIYLAQQNTTLSPINTVGGSSSSSVTFNLSDIPDEEFWITALYQFKGNNTQGEDPTYGFNWVVGTVGVKEASIGIIVPILAVLSVALIVLNKRKK